MIRRLLLVLVALVGCTSPSPTEVVYGPPANPPALLTTPGYVGETAPLVLASDTATAMHLGPAPHDVDSELTVAWRQVVPASVGWAEVAIAVGEPALGNQPLTVIGTGDVRQQAGWIGTVQATIKPQLPVIAGQELWLVMATWSPPGWGSPTVVGSRWSDPIAGGVVAVLTVPGWKPSQEIGVPVVFDAQPATRPLAAAVLVP